MDERAFRDMKGEERRIILRSKRAHVLTKRQAIRKAIMVKTRDFAVQKNTFLELEKYFIEEITHLEKALAEREKTLAEYDAQLGNKTKCATCGNYYKDISRHRCKNKVEVVPPIKEPEV